MNFKILFLRNFHPGVSHHLGVMACPRSMTIQQLHDLTQKAYNKLKMASKKGNKTSTLLNSVTKDLHWATPSCITTPESAIKSSDPVSVTGPTVRDRLRDRYQPNRWKNPWDQPRFSRNPKDKNNWKPNQTSKGNHLTHPRATRVGKQQ